MKQSEIHRTTYINFKYIQYTHSIHWKKIPTNQIRLDNYEGGRWDYCCINKKKKNKGIN